jgi:hypothetical protein
MLANRQQLASATALSLFPQHLEADLSYFYAGEECRTWASSVYPFLPQILNEHERDSSIYRALIGPPKKMTARYAHRDG